LSFPALYVVTVVDNFVFKIKYDDGDDVNVLFLAVVFFVFFKKRLKSTDVLID